MVRLLPDHGWNVSMNLETVVDLHMPILVQLTFLGYNLPATSPTKEGVVKLHAAI